MKTVLTYIAHWMMTPFRRHKQQKYADTEAADMQRVDLPNEAYLPIISKYVAAGESAIFTVKGYSMRPFLEHLRDKVELSPWTDVQVGDAVLAEIAPGHYVLHRIIVRQGDKLTLKGDGNLRGEEHCSIADVRGVVSKYIRPGGHVLSADDPHLKKNIQRWCHLPLWARRLYLFIYKQTV